MDKKKLANIVGEILLVISFVYIGRKLIAYDVDWSILFSVRIFLAVLICVLLHGLNIFFATFTYRSVIELTTGQKVKQKPVTNIYCKSNLYKYLPGNVMHFVGRNQIAIDANLPHADVALATVVEMVSLIIGGMIVTLLCSYNYFYRYIYLLEVNWTLLLGVVILGLILVWGIMYKFREKFAKALDKYKSIFVKSNRSVLLLIGIKSTSRLIVNALIFMMLMYCFGLKFTSSELVIVVLGIFVMSWVIGFVTPGAPGGLGVREFVMTVFLEGYFNNETLIVVLLVYRVICVLGDMTSYLYALIATKYILK